MAHPVVLALDDLRWSAFVASRPDATPLHHPGWADLLADCYGLKAFGFGVEVDGELVAGVPVMEVRSMRRRRRWVALPFTDALAPLGDSAGVEKLIAALRRSVEEGSVESIEIRAGVPGGLSADRGLSHVLALRPDPDELLPTFSKSQVRRNIARAAREDVRVRAAERSEDLLDIFYGLHLRTRQRLGVPVQPRRFFTLLWEKLLARDLGYLLIAEVGGRPVASAVFLAWNRKVMYKFGASDREWWGARPNHALFWDAIRRACADGMLELDFGRTDAENEGLRAFKAGWGTIEHPLVYTTIGAARSPHRSRITSSVMPPLIRHSPSWVCRMLGETLYRYAA